MDADPSAIDQEDVEDNKGNGYMFFWSQTGGLQVLIPPQSINVYPQGLTDSGQVVGNFSSAECPNDGCGFIWTQTGGFSLVKINGTPGTAVRQNADGTVIAYVGAAPYTTLHAFSWTLNGGAVDLGMLPGMSISVPRSINSKGQILGVACAISGARCKDFVWSAGQGMRVIPKSSAFSNVYWAINDAGQILGLIDYAKTVVLTPWIHVKLESSQNPSKLGQSVTFTATASSVAGPPKDGERVTFRAGKKVLGSVRLVTGVATLTTSSLVIGTHAVTATYAGDANYDAQKSGALQQVVTP